MTRALLVVNPSTIDCSSSCSERMIRTQLSEV